MTPPPPESLLGPLRIGAAHPVRLLAVLNASPESYYHGSVASGRDATRRAAEGFSAAGADMIDVGAMSTAPYKETRISLAEEVDRMGEAVAAIRGVCALPVSADTQRAAVASVALEQGACAINDVSGLAADPRMAEVVARAAAGLILMANETAAPPPSTGEEPTAIVASVLALGLERARRAGIPDCCVVLDPGVGFFRDRRMPWHQWDLRVLRGLSGLHALGLPLLVGASRKSFLGEVLGRKDPADRLAGSLATAIHAVGSGASALRVHDVAETRDALRMAELLGLR